MLLTLTKALHSGRYWTASKFTKVLFKMCPAVKHKDLLEKSNLISVLDSRDCLHDLQILKTLSCTTDRRQMLSGIFFVEKKLIFLIFVISTNT